MSKLIHKNSILLVGCGSLGRAFAFPLADAVRISCFDIDQKVVRNIRSKGLNFMKGAQRRRRKISITDRIQDYNGHDFEVIIFTTKCSDVKAAARLVSRHCRTKVVLFLQNGDLSLDWAFRIFPGSEILRGVTTTAAQADRAGGVKVLTDGTIYLGSYLGRAGRLRWLAGILRKAGMKVITVRDHRSAVWAKLIFNAVMNPLPILTGADYGIVRDDEQSYRLVCEAISEGKEVAFRMGIPLAFDPLDIVRKLRAGKFGDFRYKGSMYHDFIQGRPLELGYITGKVVRQARALKIKTPALDAVYTLTKAMETGRDSK